MALRAAERGASRAWFFLGVPLALACLPGRGAQPDELASKPSVQRDAEDPVSAAPEPQPTATAEETALRETAASPGESPKAPLEHEGPLSLDVPGFLPAVVYLPRRSGRAPLFVASHGAGGSPEWHCAFFDELFQGHALIACPRGRPISKRDDYGYYFPDHHALRGEVLALVDAVADTFPDLVDVSRATYSGYSQGATMGALALLDHGHVFPRLQLIEGGYEQFNVQAARRFSASGGERILFVCGVSGCAGKAERAKPWLEQAGVAARVEHARGAGHTPAGEVGERVAQAFSWLVQGDARWYESSAGRP